MSVNSKQYWNERFEKNWELNGGRRQTEYFTKLALKLLPESILNLFNDNLTFLDWGCAEGDGTSIIANRFPSLTVRGLDFSSSAISKAQGHFPGISFLAGSLKDYSDKYDIIFTSNCLEHYKNPFEWIHHLMEYTQKMLIIMVPFQEFNRIEEHFYTFDFKTFPLAIGSFVMNYYKVVDSNPDYWPGKQILIVYSKYEAGIASNLSLDVYNPNNGNGQRELDGYIDKLKEQINQRDEIFKHITEENKSLMEWISLLQNEVNKRDESVLSLKAELQEKDKWIEIMNEEVRKRDEAFDYLKKELNEKDKWIEALQDEVKKRDQSVNDLLKRYKNKIV